jgi:protein tyrosine/serine phosphatase
MTASTQAQEEDFDKDIFPILTHPLNLPLPLSQSTLTDVLSSPPFITVPSIFNFRDLSGLPSQPTGIAPGIAYRCGTLENLTPEGIEALKELGIKTIFDLRSLAERNAFPTVEIDGVENIWTPSTVDNVTLPETKSNPTTAATASATNTDTKVDADEGSKDVKIEAKPEIKKDTTRPFSLTDLNTNILQTHTKAFAAILRHIAANSAPFVFHCTAGKDRTGVLAFILQSLAGSSAESMDVEYTLTRLGIDPPDVREFLTLKVMHSLGMADATTEMREKVLGSEKMKVYNVIPLDAMGALKERVEEVYGGVEKMCLGWGLSEEEIKGVEKALRGDMK